MLSELLELSDVALHTEDKHLDPSFDLESSMMSDKEHIIDSFCEERVTSLDRKDWASSCFQLPALLGKGETEAAELAGLMIGKSDKTVTR